MSGPDPGGLARRLAQLSGDQWALVAGRHFELSKEPAAEQARMACRSLAATAGRLKAWREAGDQAWAASAAAERIRGPKTRPSAGLEARAAARLAAGALVVRDLLPAEQFDLLYAPFRELIPPG